MRYRPGRGSSGAIGQGRQKRRRGRGGARRKAQARRRSSQRPRPGESPSMANVLRSLPKSTRLHARSCRSARGSAAAGVAERVPVRGDAARLPAAGLNQAVPDDVPVPPPHQARCDSVTVPGLQRSRGGWMLTSETATRPAPSGTPQSRHSTRLRAPSPRRAGTSAIAPTAAPGRSRRPMPKTVAAPAKSQGGHHRDHERVSGPRHQHEADRRDRGDRAGRDHGDHRRGGQLVDRRGGRAGSSPPRAARSA